jgi:acylphosphatase
MMKKGWRITGIVQGVGFRYFVVREARGAGITGYVKNLPDGSVEVAAAGSEESMKQFEKAISTGPPQASVHRVQTFEPPPGLEQRSCFDIEY